MVNMILGSYIQFDNFEFLNIFLANLAVCLASRVATATVVKLIVTVLEDRDFILGFILLTEDAASAASEEKKCCCHFQGLNKAEFYQL